MSASLPRWHTHDQREREALKCWTVERLAEERIAEMGDSEPEWISLSHWGLFQRQTRFVQWLAALAAQHGNFQPVFALAKARLGLDLAPYLRPRKRQRGEYQRHARPWAIERAVDDVQHMRAIWRAVFEGHWKRDDGLAEEIACERWGVAPEDLANALRITSRK